jgi:glucokinase
MFTVGTGIGGGLVLDGKVFRGATGAAAELGHTLVGLDVSRGVPGPGAFPRAVGAVRTLGERLGLGIANALNIFDPDEVVIGGGVCVAGELLLEPAVEVARRFVLPGVGERARIRLARYGSQAGVRGAALLAGMELSVEGALAPAAREVERA